MRLRRGGPGCRGSLSGQRRHQPGSEPVDAQRRDLSVRNIVEGRIGHSDLHASRRNTGEITRVGADEDQFQRGRALANDRTRQLRAGIERLLVQFDDRGNHLVPPLDPLADIDQLHDHIVAEVRGDVLAGHQRGEVGIDDLLCRVDAHRARAGFGGRLCRGRRGERARRSANAEDHWRCDSEGRQRQCGQSVDIHDLLLRDAHRRSLMGPSGCIGVSPGGGCPMVASRLSSGAVSGDEELELDAVGIAEHDNCTERRLDRRGVGRAQFVEPLLEGCQGSSVGHGECHVVHTGPELGEPVLVVALVVPHAEEEPVAGEDPDADGVVIDAERLVEPEETAVESGTGLGIGHGEGDVVDSAQLWHLVILRSLSVTLMRR